MWQIIFNEFKEKDNRMNIEQEMKEIASVYFLRCQIYRYLYESTVNEYTYQSLRRMENTSYEIEIRWS